jgi:hypothetical protein
MTDLKAYENTTRFNKTSITMLKPEAPSIKNSELSPHRVLIASYKNAGALSHPGV